ncbi:ribosome-associated translation inhibitor RaiA [Saonia flava]|uniref:Ribosome-associated translation inhibitor RaiA n=1 Tax=Saonia flava TaxID=523696 RepID=A0A846QY49_9FLAO|nr:carboxypeptidase-like regulatory domain-containing protein [Saonia flava]NJB69549.1 ribosome-associated translation inhibitor RaiA [Saonia flava]
MLKRKKQLQQKFPAILILILLWVGATGTIKASAFFQDDQETSFNQYKGEVVDSQTKKPLVFATIALDGTNISTISNTEGEFLLKVPNTTTDGNVLISFLGYSTKLIPLSQFKSDKNVIKLDVSMIELSGVDITIPKDARELVKQTLAKKGENYFNDPTLMTAFYRETIKKRKKNVSLSEAVVNIYKTPYTSNRKDALQLYKARKSTDYSKLDTVALKLQGGPFNTLFVDIMKYPDYIFTEESFENYTFSFDHSTKINDKNVFVIDFKQKAHILEPLYMGKLYIDAEKKTLTTAVYSLNITNKDMAARIFVRRKPKNAKVYPTEMAYRVNYREKDGRWYYGYSNVLLEFKINWDDKFFNSVYSMTAEMAVTDWESNINGEVPKSKDRLKSSIILSDEAIGFSDPDFWGEYNIIEPEKSIESAIKKIQRQLRRAKNNSGQAIPTP